MTPTERTVAHLRIAAERAAAHHSARIPRCEARVSDWLRRRDAYRAAHTALPIGDPRRARAAMLADHAAHRALAWQSLSVGDAAFARRHCEHGQRAFARAMQIPVV